MLRVTKEMQIHNCERFFFAKRENTLILNYKLNFLKFIYIVPPKAIIYKNLNDKGCLERVFPSIIGAKITEITEKSPTFYIHRKLPCIKPLVKDTEKHKLCLQPVLISMGVFGSA